MPAHHLIQISSSLQNDDPIVFTLRRPETLRYSVRDAARQD
jgi:hypothetical protein